MKKLLSIIGISLFSLANPAYAGVLQTSPVSDFNTGEPIGGTLATLDRMQDSVNLMLNTELLPGTYTVWWVIFNNPEFCVDGCNLDDLGIAQVNASAFWATGEIVGDDGIGSFSAQINEGELPMSPGQILFGDGLVDSFLAEIYTIVRSHGPVIPGQEEEQTTTFNGGCPPNNCEDIQFTIFRAVSVSEPTSPLGFLALGTLGAASTLKRKLKPSKEKEVEQVC